MLRHLWIAVAVGSAATGAVFLAGRRDLSGPLLIVTFASLALYCRSHPVLRGFTFTAWVFTFVSASMVYPWAFMKWFGFDLGILIVPLIQVIMFGMGTTLSVADFTRVARMPWPVFIGFVLQFTIMPLTALTLAKVFGFEPEVAAGVVLIGSVPGGVASNVMTYLAGGNVPLSVTMTACSTLVSPVMTPFLMERLAGQLIDIEFVKMMFEIVSMIIVPIVAGLIANRILYGRQKSLQQSRILLFIGLAAVAAGVCIALFAPAAVLTWREEVLKKDGFVVGMLLVGLVALTKLVTSVWLKRAGNWMDRTLPIVSMAGIVLIIAIITARSAEKLMTVGIYLIGAAIVLNLVGYVLGYWCARIALLDESSCRTVAIEVGMQNGGMASGLAMNVLHSAPAALAPAVFGPWMNISGSILATWWHRKPPTRGASKTR
ncbi:MAG TPA: bile acid:sodium symporter family protein [Sedimentisphaerales bacterium]|nr:bile acid:sodium symporter family protein [Sedimentisphaerales bacterium]